MKKLALDVHAPIIKTAGGIWLFSPAVVEKLRAEIHRRKVEALR